MEGTTTTHPSPSTLHPSPSPHHPPPSTRFYQLTHDYLVPALREWLTRKQKETRRGRAELWLAERAAIWTQKPQNRRLPAWWEVLNILCFTRKANWTGLQHRMMTTAMGYHAVRSGSALAVAFVLSIIIQRYVSAVQTKTSLERVITAVQAVANSPVAAVPYAIRDLEILPRDMVVKDLEDRFTNTEDNRKLHLACALAHFGQVDQGLLVASIKTAHGNAVPNLVDALSVAGNSAVVTLRQEAEKASQIEDWRHKARVAIVALHLGNTSLAQDMLRVQERPDPIQRTILIDTFPIWYGPLSDLANIVKRTDDTALRSGICLGVGGIPVEQVTAYNKEIMGALWKKWYVEARDTGTHSATGWALGKWKLQVPAIAPSKQPVEGRDWHVNSIGMTMLKVPAGSFFRKDDADDTSVVQKVNLTRSFLLSDREVSVGVFQPIIHDPDCPPSENPQDRKTTENRYSSIDANPIVRVNWYDSVLFCNWLSRKEGLNPCYKGSGEIWDLVPEAVGYRLPCGHTYVLLKRKRRCSPCEIRRFNSNSAEPCGSKLPNGWGFFDLHGNVAEWCYDNYAGYGRKNELIDPIVHEGEPQGLKRGRVLRGGYFSFTLIGRNVRSAGRSASPPLMRNSRWGFRPARTYNLSP